MNILDILARSFASRFYLRFTQSFLANFKWTINWSISQQGLNTNLERRITSFKWSASQDRHRQHLQKPGPWRRNRRACWILRALVRTLQNARASLGRFDHNIFDNLISVKNWRRSLRKTRSSSLLRWMLLWITHQNISSIVDFRQSSGPGVAQRTSQSSTKAHAISTAFFRRWLMKVIIEGQLLSENMTSLKIDEISILSFDLKLKI